MKVQVNVNVCISDLFMRYGAVYAFWLINQLTDVNCWVWQDVWLSDFSPDTTLGRDLHAYAKKFSQKVRRKIAW